MDKILVVDDEQDLCEILRFNLESEGYAVDTANSAEEALEILGPQHSLILLDVMMDKMSGYQMLNIVRRERNNDIPIIFLTAKSTENDQLTGFNLGADDYITKPFSIKTVLARVKAVLKRYHPDEKPDSIPAATTISADDLSVDLVSKRVFANGEEIQLTRKEFLILAMLIQNSGKYFSREEILGRVWDGDTLVTDRSVDVHIARLRKKLGTAGNHISNRIGFGYYFKN
ncbi:MAG: response regulator transcription factor [Bacteroidales bacterium]|nr:response regulator transcription factor [Bacteroidales bacterium]MBR5027947.1 response regulator transcription factor [Bacteroidales bacterium]